ncbi:MAG: hypothetical protein ACRD1H_20610 [Vicinamibacterales bacterium]
MATRRRWPYVVLGVAVLLVFVGIGAIIASIAWFQQNMQVETSSERDAQTEFDSVRQKFGGREPLLEMHDGVPRYTRAREESRSTAGVSLSTLNILVWDPDDERLARIALPFWLLRMKSDPIQLGAYASGLDEGGVNVRPEDIEKYGAGVILDTGTSSGERVLLWAQ